MFTNRLQKVYKHISKLARRQDIACYRFYDHDLPEFPFVIEMYKDVVYATYKRKHGMEDDENGQWEEECRQVIASVTDVVPENIFMKPRQRKADRQGGQELVADKKEERIVPEGGLSFIINLTDYLDTGLYLNHRITRGMVRDEAKGLKVLNLFCYTGAFSLYAASGGAEEIVSVDISKTYLNWGKRNMQYNKLYKLEKFHFIHADVMEWIATELPNDYFDIIICDPPSFSKSKRMEDTFEVQRDHVKLLKQLLKGCTDTGRVYFSTNQKDFAIERDSIPATNVKDITGATTPFDFQGKLNRSCFLIEK